MLLSPEGTARAQPDALLSGPLSLSDAVRLSLTRNPAILEARAQLDIAAERIVQARAGFMPQIDTSGVYNRTNNPAQGFAAKLNQGVFSQSDFDVDRLNNPDPVDNYTGRVTAVWPLYDSGQTWHGVQQAELERQAADLEMTRVRQHVIARTVIAYVGVLTAQENLAVVRQTLETARAHEKMVVSRFDSGFVVKSDLLRARVHISDLEQQELQAASAVEIARAELNDAAGVAIESEFELTDQLDSGVEIADPLAHWIETALDRRTDLKQLEIRQSVAGEEIKKSRAAHLPSLNLTGDYEVNTGDFEEGGDNYSVGAVVTFNLFSGNRTSAKVREARAAERQAAAVRRGLEQRIRVETRQAYLQAENAWRRIQVARAAVIQAEEALRIVGNRYAGGLLTIVDLLNAELALQRARSNQLQAVHDYKVAGAKLMLAAGSLDENQYQCCPLR